VLLPEVSFAALKQVFLGSDFLTGPIATRRATL
jgi:hypothetical protein